MSARRVRVDALRLPAEGGAPAAGELAEGISRALAGMLRRHGMPAPGAARPFSPGAAPEEEGMAGQVAAHVYRALGGREG